jgi:hypothetical protein
MAAISLFWYTNMAAVTSDENDLLAIALPFLYDKYVVLSYSFCNLHGHEI